MISLVFLSLIAPVFSWNEDFDYDYEYDYDYDMEVFDEYEFMEEQLTVDDLDMATKCEICTDLVTSAENFVREKGSKYLVDFVREKACTKVPKSLQNACAEIGTKVIEVALRELIKLLDPTKVCKKIKMC
ncbi:hypothetical protein BLNAU_117 [Blattamonas nauphoetae]|uniref:Saposin B-type domain-containing protein n=1 Tax=Blattamonas nauphoetae TaxID=2049346 RepID=A0ABQ9YM51_9EUKA|nr:hypothetical protein BLNAU_117 [Blattamonas nauphoetae]